MIEFLRRAYDVFRGIDPPERIVPVMDGPLHPNSALDEAPVLIERDGIDTLCAAPDGLYASSGAELLSLRSDATRFAAGIVATFPAPITCIASDGAGGLAIGQDGAGILIRGGKHDGIEVRTAVRAQLACPTACVFADPDTLIVANGSVEHCAADWKRDLMKQRRSGSVWRIDLRNPASAAALASDLFFPSGVALGKDGNVHVSEAWAHRVISLNAAGPSETRELLGELPAYPGRIAAARDGSFWLALFAPRNPLVEFVIGERKYRELMLETLHPDHWIAPALHSGKSFLEPIQGGARKKLNMLKPWSPSWSCGLVLHCDGAFRPRRSFHSRADGQVHGVTSCAEWQGRMLIAAKGSGRVVSLGAGDPGGGGWK